MSESAIRRPRTPAEFALALAAALILLPAVLLGGVVSVPLLAALLFAGLTIGLVGLPFLVLALVVGLIGLVLKAVFALLEILLVVVPLALLCALAYWAWTRVGRREQEPID